MDISILAGNTRIKKHDDGSFGIDPQIRAFEAAMRYASGVREHVKRIAVAVDHKVPVQELLDPGLKLTRKQGKSLRLSHLREEFRSEYAHIAEGCGIPMGDIRLIMERHSCNDIRCLIKEPTFTYYRPYVDPSLPLGSKVTDIPTSQVNCKGVTAAIIKRLDRPLGGKGHIRTFWEERWEWTDPWIIKEGTRLALGELGVRSPVTETMMDFRRRENTWEETDTVYRYNEDTGEVEIT